MPKRSRRLPALAAAVAAFACVGVGVRATDESRLEPMWVDALAADGTAGRTTAALLNLPPGWMLGDAAVVLVSHGPWSGSSRERLVSALLDEGAAVLELDLDSPRGFISESAFVPPPPTAEELLPDVRGAAEALRREAGAGLVVALGHGTGGEAAVAAAALERQELVEGGASAMAAAASLGPGPARFASGGAVPGPGWPVRAGLLCQVLATEALASEPGAEGGCRRALVGPGGAFAVRAGGP